MEKISKNKIKFLRSLGLKKNRQKEEMFLVEGEKIVQEALQYSRHNLLEIYVEKSADLDFVLESDFDKDKLFEMNATEASQISTFKTPNKCLALLKFPQIEAKNKDFTLVLDQIQDPGNMGTIIRLADWFGVDDIICSKDTADCFNPKVIQATMGSLFRTQVQYLDLKEYLSNDERPVHGALLDGDNVYKMNLPKKTILVMGNEGNGISPEIQELISEKVLIPRFGKAESLNVANATGILLSEFFRG